MKTRSEKILGKIISFILCAVILTLCLPVSASAEEGAFSEPGYYGRSALAKLQNSEALLYVYDRLVAGVLACEESISVNDGENEITLDEFKMVCDAYRRDYTEHFWLDEDGGKMSYNPETNVALTYAPSYIMTGAELASAKASFESGVEMILSGIDSSMSEFERELYIHDTLAKRVTYDLEAENAHNAYGAIAEGRAVCDGYSEAFHYLLRRAGIQSFVVIGSSENPATKQAVGHAWNIVRIDGKYYHTDLTWNDQGDKIYHAYFNLTDAEIKEDHEITETAYELPECNSGEANYFNVKGGKISSYTVQTIGALLKNNGLTASVYIQGSAEDFISWYRANILDIAAAAEVSGGLSYFSSHIGREIIIGIETCGHTELTPVEAKAPSCEENGNIAHYICSCGKYFINRDTPSSLIEVTLYATGHTAKSEVQRTETHHFYQCESCGAEISKNPHSYDGACDGVCDGCGYTRAVTHDYSDAFRSDEDNHWKQCSCGATANIAEHTDHNEDGECDTCGHAVPLPSKNGVILGIDTSKVKTVGILALAVVGVIAVFGIWISAKRK
jgi:hypothetical protein